MAALPRDGTWPGDIHSVTLVYFVFPLFGASMPCPLLCVQTPFIRYEYILPTSHPPPSPSQHDTEKAQCQGQQPSSYQVLYPYVPPALNQEFYIPPEPHPHWEPTLPSHPSPPCPQPYQHGEYSSGVDQAPQEPHQDSADGGGQEGCQDGVEVPHVVDMPIIDRSFHPYETHYVEEPLLLIDPDSPSPVLYESSHFEQKLTEETEKAKAAEKEGELVISVADDSVQDSQDLTDMKSGDIDASKTSQVGRSGDAGDGRKAVSPSEKHTGVSSSQVKENGHVVSVDRVCLYLLNSLCRTCAYKSLQRQY